MIELDLLRIVAALAVVAYHFTYRGSLGEGFSPLAFPEVAAVTRYGFLGVELFFLVSGFVILRSAEGRSVRQFVSSRFVRLYPAYWAALAATAAVVWLTDQQPIGPAQVLVNISMAQEVVGVRSVHGVAWTLTVELLFYVLVTIAIAARGLGHVRLLLPAWLVVSTVTVALDAPEVVRLVLVSDWAWCFAAGAACHLLSRNRRDPVVLGTLVISSLGAVTVAASRAAAMNTPEQVSTDPRVAAGITLAWIVCMVLIATGARVPVQARWVVPVAALTYPLYLLHENIGYAALAWLGPEVGRWAALALVMAGSVAASAALHHGVERPSQAAWRRRTRAAAPVARPEPSPILRTLRPTGGSGLGLVQPGVDAGEVPGRAPMAPRPRPVSAERS